ncbi:MAG: hypothetical protein ABH833_04190 [Parcubacteria group bacterium]
METQNTPNPSTVPVIAGGSFSATQIVIAVVVLLAVGGVAWAGYSYLGSKTEQKLLVDVIESMEEVDSMTFEASFNILITDNSYSSGLLGGLANTFGVFMGDEISDDLALSPIIPSSREISFTVDINGASDTTDIDNQKFEMNMDVGVEGADLEYMTGTDEPLSISMQMKGIGDVVYVKLDRIGGMSPLGISISTDKWIKIDPKDLAELEELTGSLGAPTYDDIDEERLNALLEPYMDQFVDIMGKYDIVKVLSSGSGPEIEGEETTSSKFTVNKEETVDFWIEAMPVFTEMMDKIYFELFGIENMILGDADLSDFTDEEIAEGKAEILKMLESVSLEGSATIGNDSAIPYDMEFNLDIDVENLGSMETSFDFHMRDINEPVIVEEPEDYITLIEFIEGMDGMDSGYDYNNSAADDVKRVADVNNLRTAIEMYYDDFGEYPDMLGDLVTEGYLMEEPYDPFWDWSYDYASSGNKYQISADLDSGYPDEGNLANDSDIDASSWGGVDGNLEECSGFGWDCFFDLGSE